VDYRQRVLAEALAQRDAFRVYYRGLLMWGPNSHPNTNRLMHIAIQVGEFQAMHYKRIFERPRASQLSPALMPPIAVPGHASYPSGHSTQSHLLSGLFAQFMPAAVTTPVTTLQGAPNPVPPTAPGSVPWAGSLLDRVAERVSRNREVLGLHYPSDTAAGVILARQSLVLLLQCPTVITLVAAAQLEWQ